MFVEENEIYENGDKVRIIENGEIGEVKCDMDNGFTYVHTTNTGIKLYGNDEIELIEGENMEIEKEKSDCKDTNCIDNCKGQCTRISDDGRYGICWMTESEGEY